jgi:hypothetical protein
MKRVLFLCALAGAAFSGLAADSRTPIALFDGRTFAGWDGDTNQTWRIRDGMIVGGSLTQTVPRNEFLATTRRFTNFVLRVTFKLLGTEGFVNSGIQLRSERATDPPNEMIGYQCDIGEGWWGALYDESRRNQVLVRPPDPAVQQAVKPGDWNTYTIRCEGRRIRSFLNDQPMIDYVEQDSSLPQHGRIGLQVHGGGKAELWVKSVTVEELP